MGMTGISKSQVSRLCSEIDDKIAAFLDRPLEGEWPYLWLDTTYVKARCDGRVVSVAVIVAVGVSGDGRREVEPRPLHDPGNNNAVEQQSLGQAVRRDRMT
jgi:putative transposase